MKRAKSIVAVLWCVYALGAIADDDPWVEWFSVSGTIGEEVIPDVDAPATNTLTKVEISFASGAMDVADLDEPSDAQVAFAAAYDGSETNYYACVSGAWRKLEGATPADGSAVTLTATFNYATTPVKVSFAVDANTLSDGTTTDFALSTGKGQLESLAFSGSGTVNSVDADVKGADAEADNGISYAASYALNLDPTDPTATLKAEPVENPTEGSGTDVKVKVKIPVTPREGYAVMYQVMKFNGSDWEAEGEAQSDKNAVLVPAASGRYRVDAVITK